MTDTQHAAHEGRRCRDCADGNGYCHLDGSPCGFPEGHPLYVGADKQMTTDTQTQTPHERAIREAQRAEVDAILANDGTGGTTEIAITAYLNAMRASQEQDWHKIDDREVFQRLQDRHCKTNLEHDALRLIETLKARIEWASMQPVAQDVNAELLEALRHCHTLIYRARMYSGYGYGPLSEPFAQMCEHRAATAIANATKGQV